MAKRFVFYIIAFIVADSSLKHLAKEYYLEDDERHVKFKFNVKFQIAHLLNVGLYCFIWISVLYNYIYVSRLMFKNHKYEFKKNKKWLTCYSVFLLLALFVHIVQVLINFTGTYHLNDGYRLLQEYINCNWVFPKMSWTKLRFGQACFIDGKFLKLGYVSTGLVLIKLKSSDDIL